MSATILRQWLVLTMLPRPPRRIDTGSIEARLRERGIEVHRRTIQRDLLDLAEVFPIVADERARPYGWRWSDDAEPGFDVPAPKRMTTAPEIELLLRVRRTVLELLDRRLGVKRSRVSDDERDPTFALVFATVPDTKLARRMLVAHGDEIEVLGPASLRREIAERARRVLELHAR